MKGHDSHKETPVSNFHMATLLYIAKDSQINRTKLNKVCFFIDVAHMFTKNDTLSHFKYRKADFGPIPVGIEEIRDDLVRNELLECDVIEGPYYVEYAYKTVSSNVNWPYVEELLGKDGIETIKRVNTAFSNSTATWLSNQSHRLEPWKSGEWYSELDLKIATSDKEMAAFLKDYKIIA